MTSQIRIHLVQMTSSTLLDENLTYIAKELGNLPANSVDMIVLPEMFAQFGVSDQRPLAQGEEHFDGKVGRFIRGWARRLTAWVIAGTIPVAVQGDARPVARCHVIDSNGILVSHYDKIHLFDAMVSDSHGQYRESDSYSPGHDPVVFDSPWGKVGLAVCYDLRFPELFRMLNDAGAQVIILPSAFTAKTGQAHWEILCRARAVENGVFMVAVNQCGLHDCQRSTWGHSMVVDPWGEVTDVGSQQVSQTVVLDLDRVCEVRQQLPVNQHRRL